MMVLCKAKIRKPPARAAWTGGFGER
jgi:hypothetical protein